MSDRSLSILVHGAARVGKTTFAYTAPYPRLVLDAEKGSRFIKAIKKKWDPMSEPPPIADGTWDTVVVNVTDFDIVLKAYEWLRTGRHQFRSVILDSVSELQDKCKVEIAGQRNMKTQDWGALLQRMGAFCRDLRDLVENPIQPIEAVVIIAMSRNEDGVIKPFLQGQLKIQIPYWYDVTGYLYIEDVPDDVGGYTKVQRLLSAKNNLYEAGSRVPDLSPVIDSPNIEKLLDSTFGPRVEVPIAPEA